MRRPCNSFPSLRDAINVGGTPPPDFLIGAEHRAAYGDLLRGSAITSGAEDLRGRSVLIAAADQLVAALALIELDGLARRVILYPLDLALEHLPYVMRYAEVDAVVSDGQALGGASLGAVQHALCTAALAPRSCTSDERLPTEWVLLTSGTTGRPKMVLHTLASLAGAIGAGESDAEVTWSTFYDIRRYGGLQIFLRAVLAGSSMVLAGPQEPVANFLQRAGEAGVTHISGTPSHWRRALMSPQAGRIAPRYVRLSGEIADQSILNSLRSFYPDARISHAFATTEAGVAFDVRDGLSGFPATMLTSTAGVEMKMIDATLRVRSNRTADRYLGENPPALKDADGYVDTGDVLELRDGRYHFQGRRDGVINV
ncbi:MAG: AMP-binding protein, partial [Tepidisphaeraceae bacterium]